jgi:hypothetical protein
MVFREALARAVRKPENLPDFSEVSCQLDDSIASILRLYVRTFQFRTGKEGFLDWVIFHGCT